MDDEVLYVGPCPAEEDAVQIGEADYPQRAKAQCRAFIEAIRKTLGQEPEGAKLSVASQPHDFGSYYEVVVRFDANDRAAAEYAYRVEAKAPTTWADAGMEPPNLGGGWKREEHIRRVNESLRLCRYGRSMKRPRPFALPSAGFTLMELSIVLVILALLTGGIVAGKELIAQYELRRQMSEIEKYVLATRLFKMKFNSLPGDYNRAFQIWGEACGPNVTRCNGNNNGTIRDGVYDTRLYWVHLSLSGFIGEVNYGPMITASTTPGGYAYLIPGVHVPKSRINGETWGGFGDVDWWGSYFVRDTFFSASTDYGIARKNVFWLAGIRRAGAIMAFDGAVVSPWQAFHIDTKMDDGRASTGKVIGVSGRAMPTGDQRNCVTPNSWSSSVPAAEYDLATRPDQKACALGFDMIW